MRSIWILLNLKVRLLCVMCWTSSQNFKLCFRHNANCTFGWTRHWSLNVRSNASSIVPCPHSVTKNFGCAAQLLIIKMQTNVSLVGWLGFGSFEEQKQKPKFTVQTPLWSMRTEKLAQCVNSGIHQASVLILGTTKDSVQWQSDAPPSEISRLSSKKFQSHTQGKFSRQTSNHCRRNKIVSYLVNKVGDGERNAIGAMPVQPLKLENQWIGNQQEKTANHRCRFLCQRAFISVFKTWNFLVAWP